MNKPIVVDSHHHFWDPARARYPWLTDELAAIRRPFCPDDLRPELAAAGVDYTVLVQTRSSEDETRAFMAIAAPRRMSRNGSPRSRRGRTARRSPASATRYTTNRTRVGSSATTCGAGYAPCATPA